MNMLEIPVKLIVKAPNQQFEDQTIQCNLSWTIKRLKGYLSEVYPSKPNTEDQRLIYYGQLLNDSVTLKDVFTRYEAGEETHTVHLVCMPSKEILKMQARKTQDKNPKKKETEGSCAPSSSRSNDRVSVDGNDNTLEQDTDSSRSTEGNYLPTFGHNNYWLNNAYPQPHENYNYMQIAWMQRLYINYYMSQYMDMIARQNGNILRDGNADPRQTEAAHNPEPQQRREEEDEDNRVNRDWLDYFYIFSRLLILLSIVCFYSSPARFIIVVVPGILLYLYQIGFFRLNHGVQGVENNNDVVNNNAAADNNNTPHQGEGNEGGQSEDASRSNANQEPVAEVPERPSFIALTWTFVTSFISSMIPEMQNPI